MADDIVAHNLHLSERCGTLRTILNSGHTLRLYRNNFTPVQATVLADFTECNLAGYAGLSLAAQFGAPTQVVTGKYQTASGVNLFTTSDAGGQTIYGWYIDDGAIVRFSKNYLAGVTFSLAIPLAIQVLARVYSRSPLPA